MKFSFLIVFCFTNFFCFSQSQSLVAKWKPISFSLGNLLEGDFSQDKPNIKISIDSLVKNDKDPEMAKQMMEMVLQMTFEKTKSLLEEYKENGVFVETDINTGKIKEGKYLFDDSKNILTKWYNNSANKVNFKIKIAKNTLTIKSDLKTKEGEAQQELTIIYNKI